MRAHVRPPRESYPDELSVAKQRPNARTGSQKKKYTKKGKKQKEGEITKGRKLSKKKETSRQHLHTHSTSERVQRE